MITELRYDLVLNIAKDIIVQLINNDKRYKRTPSIQILEILADTDSGDRSALQAIQSSWSNLPPSWKGSDPCGSNWEGIVCNGTQVTSLMLAGQGISGNSISDVTGLTHLQYLDLSNNVGLRATLPPSISNLQNLTILVLVGCSFFGPIPDSIGSLPNLIYISLNSNGFTGPIPASIGNLANLSWLDLSDNKLNGTIPVSSGTTPGLDKLFNARHFHLSKNQLSGAIPPQLFSQNMKLIHAILDNNQLTGSIPDSLFSVNTLEVIRLDFNSLNGSVPLPLNNLTKISELNMANNNLRGPVPDFTGMNGLNFLDMSNNSFDPSPFPSSLSSIQSLTTLTMENTKLQGEIPVNFFSLPQLQTVTLSNNLLNGTLSIGNSYSSSLELDLRNNFITDFRQKSGYSIELDLVGNPICGGNGSPQKFCVVETNNNFLAPLNNCSSISCSSGQILSPNCRCAYPYTGTIHFFSHTFSDLSNFTYYRSLQGTLISVLRSDGLPVDSINISDPSIDVYSYLQFRIQIFPSLQENFNRTSVSTIGFLLNRQPFTLDYFGPFYFLDDKYEHFAGEKKSSHTGVIVGATVGAVAVFLLILGGLLFVWRRSKRREEMISKPFACWQLEDGNGDAPQLKGARWLSFDELKKCTDSFSDSNCIGVGGYGKVYKGTLASGQVVAIKRAQQGSMQGAVEFKTEIELLSRIHHKNVVGLVGFCYDQGEQMLVYEYISNGTLRENLSGKSGTCLNWMRRLAIALDAARGLTYLHELANPPIIHRDVKSNNILLDDHFNAKVADFGLSKPVGDEDKGYISTQVKGTLGYMDPEYYMTQQLTEKSDVYSFGIVLLELMTARAPIERGKHIAKEVQVATNYGKDTTSYSDFVDPKLAAEGKPGGLEKFLELAMRCVQEFGSNRPTMNEVVREIENIIQLASLSKKTSEADQRFRLQRLGLLKAICIQERSRGSLYDLTAIRSLQSLWQNTPPNWSGSDPCGAKWDGISCSNDRIVAITLASLGLAGTLSSDIAGLSELLTLDLSYNPELTGALPDGIGNLAKLTSLALIGCNFNSPIPDTIGNLKQLQTLSLNSNKFIGPIPASFGKLQNLHWLDLADNRLSGSIPVSNATSPGLDQLLSTKHFHFGKNQLSGNIPSQLFSANMSLIHLLLDSNQLTGSIPDSLALVQALEVVRLDKNSLSGQVPRNLSNLQKLQELYLSNNDLAGPLPDLTGMALLNYLDISNNTFNASGFPTWSSTLQSLTTLVMENTNLQGQIPGALFSLPQLQSVILKNNQLNGTLSIDAGSDLQRIDLQNNYIQNFTPSGNYHIQIILAENPFCQGGQQNYCIIIPPNPNLSYPTSSNNCFAAQCKPDQTVSPNCMCSYPYAGTLFFRAPSFSDLGNQSLYDSLERTMMIALTSEQLPVESVIVYNPSKNLDNYLTFNLQVFPSAPYHFDYGAISKLAFFFSNQIYKPPDTFGPYYFIPHSYQNFGGSNQLHVRTGIIVGASVGGSVLVLLLVIAGVYAFRQKRKAELAAKQIDPFALWDSTKTSGGVPQLKGARNFTFDEVKKYTNNFSAANDLGSGGYGKVYRGVLPNGHLVAIKRAQQGSMQGALEFKTEIELLSRVHHKNVVSLVGFCFDQGEEMLVYEFIPNGTLQDSLSGKSGIRLDWMRRLRIALGAARGIQYLHVHANPPVIHRDIKSNNVLLDDKLNAKVADFGLSKPVGSPGRTHVTTQVKGTMGYMDPEYYMTNKLTEKSDVYSFGVLLLELITARPPIHKGKYIVREVKQMMDKTENLYNLQDIIDPLIVSNAAPESLEKYVDLALNCVEEEGIHRPTMSEVVKQLENITELAGMNPNAGSASTSESFERASRGLRHPYSDESLFLYSGAYHHPRVEPK
ncbi:OLC1v1038784C1 [Oldenlandia corymbosa var. corymbosa]|uniref:non-specific serine/threonine protein kinase n=1 Tax=Oldenlandia corymbosa var. corymbosa TaxID=529605 RepID=A0AAV1D394_OLDCO|nr:OLC1v1038784C1 [Oldenlandia corymbosa var. corymbosa]